MTSMAGQTAAQLPQYMQRSALISMLLSLGLGRMAPVGQEATVEGSSHDLLTISWLIARHGAMDADDGDVRAVAGPAHVHAAGHGDAQLGRHRLLAGEIRRAARP